MLLKLNPIGFWLNQTVVKPNSSELNMDRYKT